MVAPLPSSFAAMTIENDAPSAPVIRCLTPAIRQPPLIRVAVVRNALGSSLTTNSGGCVVRRLSIALIAVAAGAALAMAAVPAQASVVASSQSGPFVSAFFSPEPAAPAPGDEYQDVVVSADAFTGGRARASTSRPG